MGGILSNIRLAAIFAQSADKNNRNASRPPRRRALCFRHENG
jgi:hypothetical protein